MAKHYLTIMAQLYQNVSTVICSGATPKLLIFMSIFPIFYVNIEALGNIYPHIKKLNKFGIRKYSFLQGM